MRKNSIPVAKRRTHYALYRARSLSVSNTPHTISGTSLWDVGGAPLFEALKL